MTELRRPELFCFECGRYASKHKGLQKCDLVLIGYLREEVDFFFLQCIKELEEIHEMFWEEIIEGKNNEVKHFNKLEEAIDKIRGI